ncbi:MAG: hypothetical protein E7649_04270 [Ruminococcaceae bacterium]|nr:hypothetical protein [Oscillospiraceae bacterium]
MKTMKIVSLLLVIATLCCTFISCDTEEVGNTDLPEREFYTVTVSFQIKSADYKTQIDVKDYTYKGHAKPTILTVLNSYLSIVEEWTCKIDKENTLTQIGGMKANKKNGDYWGFVTNVENVYEENDKGDTVMDENGNPVIKEIKLKDMSAIDLSREQIKKYESDEKMGNIVLMDGAEFTVILFKSEEE